MEKNQNGPNMEAIMDGEIIETLKAPKAVFGQALYTEISLNQALADYLMTP